MLLECIIKDYFDTSGYQSLRIAAEICKRMEMIMKFHSPVLSVRGCSITRKWVTDFCYIRRTNFWRQWVEQEKMNAGGILDDPD